MRCSMARLTASRSSLFLIGLPTGIATGLDVEGVFVGDGAARTILFFRSFGNRRVLLLTECISASVAGWFDVCSVWANPATVGLLGVLLASCCCSVSVTGWLDVWAISVRVSVACPPPLQCVGQPSSRRATGRTASFLWQTVGHPSSCWATGSAASL